MGYLTVSDPKHDGQVVFLHPNQGLCLDMTLPHDRKDGEDWIIECFSPYFLSGPVEYRDGRKICYFDQLYDLKPWTRISSVMIGEVRASWKGRKMGGGFQTRMMNIILQGRHDEQRDTLTVINPICDSVRIHPHQLLEVVLHETDVNDFRHRCIMHHATPKGGYGHLRLLEVGQKTVVHYRNGDGFRDVNDDPNLINRHTLSLSVNPKLAAKLPPPLPKKNSPAMYRAIHFFYQIDPKCVDTVHRMPNDTYETANLNFYDEKNGMNSGFAVDVSFVVKGSSKPKLRRMGLSRKQRLLTEPHLTKYGVEIGKLALAKEHLFEKNTLLVTPTGNDNVEFVEGENNCLVVEIAQPHVFDKNIDRKVKWTIETDPVWQFRWRHSPEVRLTTQPLDSRNILGYEIQRFVVTPRLHETRDDNKMVFLGLVKLTCGEMEKMTRFISFYLLASGVKNGSTYKGSKSKHKHPLVMAPTKPPEKSRFKVAITEFDDDSIALNGITMTKFTDIKMEPPNSNKDKKK